MKTFGLGKMTVGSLLKRPETVRYPFESRPLAPGFRGVVAIDGESCIFCGLCARACPASALAVNRKERRWVLDEMACVQCGCCVDVCPKDCLSMEAARPAVGDGRCRERVFAGTVEEGAQ